MMPMGIFPRRTAAFVGSTTPFRVAVVVPLTTTTATSSSSFGIMHLHVRGGDQQQVSTWSTSTCRAATTVPQSASSERDVDHHDASSSTIDQEAQASLSIVGSSVQSASFQGVIPYLDTRNCQEFRVLFVLGGPGAGKVLVGILFVCVLLQ